MNAVLPTDRIAKLCKSESAVVVEPIQKLWSGYGEISRLRLLPENETVVVKHVCPPQDQDHKYGWTTEISHQRKLSSYKNELVWYRNVAGNCVISCRMAELLASESDGKQWLLVLEDLDASGFPLRYREVKETQVSACLRWLANLHSHFLTVGESPARELGLWPIGTYWHLQTRPEEYESMPESNLKSAATKIDQRLNESRFQTIVHGDAKLANFCFSDSDEVAAVDFQYVGGGCGIKDFAYFISSCFGDAECEQREASLLDCYFGHLKAAIGKDSLANKVEREWRELYPFAWADFYRFLSGWSPGHWKMHRYSERLTQIALAQL